MLDVLAERETATATELAAELPVTRQAVSKHLGTLRAAGLAEAMEWIARVGGEWDARLAALRRHLGSG